MCEVVERFRNEGIEIGLQRGVTQGEESKTKTVVRNMLKRNMSLEDICALAECAPEFVEEVKESL